MADEIILNEKIRELIQTNGLPSQDNLKQVIKDLLMYMKHEEMSESDQGLGHEPIFNSDFPGDDDPSSLFKRINWRADLDEGEGALNFDSLFNNDTALGNNGIWNESVKDLIKYFKDYFVNLDENKTITVSGKEANGASVSNNFYIIRNILKANAGNHFKMVEDKDANSNKWTLPHLNIDNVSYGNVRGNDKILEVLESAKNLDFTHTQDQVESTTQDDSAITKYIRLLMPKYIRRVEVEDLNRNFWVIGQVLSIVCAALFDDDSPIPQMLKKLSSETLQLWENVLYLWAAVNLLNEKEGEAPAPEEITAVHREVIDYPRAVDKPFRDISSFTNVPDFDALKAAYEADPQHKDPWWWRLKGYKELYSASHLCLLIRCRFGNYEKDYYHTEVYPYLVIYNRNQDHWYYIKLKDYENKTLGITLRIDSSTYTNPSGTSHPYDYMNIRGRVFGLVEKTPTSYQTCYPFSMFPPKDNYKRPPEYTQPVPQPKELDGAGQFYHAMVSIAPSISGVNYTSNNNGGIISCKIKFSVSDIARKLNFLTRDDSSHPRNPSTDNYMDEGYPDRNGNTDGAYYEGEFTLNNYEPISQSDTEVKIEGNTSPFEDWPKRQVFNVDPNTHVFFTTNQRDSGYQMGLRDMISYIGTTADAT